MSINESQRKKLLLSQSKNKHFSINNESTTVMFLKDLAGRYLYVNRGFEKLLSLSSDEVKGKTDYDFLSHHIADPIVRNDQIVAQSGLPHELEEKVPHGDVLHTYKTVKIPVPDTSGKVFAVCGIAVDITEHKKAEANLQITNTIFESKVGIMVTDADSVILRVNRSFVEMTGYSEEEVLGHTPKMLQSGLQDAEFYRQMWESINRTGEWQGEVWDKRKNGELYPKWLSITAVKDDQCKVTHYVGMHYDISERKKSEEKIEELAFFDPLTHLPDRTLLRDRLKQATIDSNRDNIFGALLLIDLDHFKTLNDTMGHDKGDLLLQLVAQILTNCVREGDTIARLGGDEFVVVLKGLSEDAEEAANQTEVVGTKILVVLNHIYQLGGINHRCTASIGATLFNGDKVSIDDLFKQAELAMYKSKDAGRNALRFFDSNMEIAVMKRASLENDLHEAVRDKQFLLHYQAKITDHKLTGSEVLVRWQHPKRGLVPPDEFIPLAEENGLILPLGKWVLETACTQLAIWALQPEMAHLSVAVNVSARQFHQPGFVDQVFAVLKETGANPHNLKLELTESMLAYDIEDVIEKMYSLKAKGIKFSLDDFGTGFSSLSYLKRLPLDQLKIDKSFVRDVLVDTNDAAIAKTIIALADSLGLGVIAEGVETEAQRDFLANSGCYSYQGYYFSRPLPLAEFELLARRF
jgi:diguanylate cyclase (GGDEF)-like protein/PAS domain S-box-containing protein